jgi:8-oxo-dGTP pyrophosphatase MutT (NUDIX family)
MSEHQFWIGVHAVIEEQGKILVLRRAATMVYQPGKWDLPGGHMAADETFEQCLLREVAEETGLNVAVERLAGVNRAPGLYVQILYHCRMIGEAREIVLQPHEHDAWRWVAREELRAMDDLIPYLVTAIARGMV